MADAGSAGMGDHGGVSWSSVDARRATGDPPRRGYPLRVGHKGAADIAPGNTIGSFRAALAAGVDVIEFDVLSERPDGSGRLFLAHDYEELGHGRTLGLAEGLEHLAGAAYEGLGLDVDIKLPGYAARVLDALHEAGLAGRSIVTSTYPGELDVIRAIDRRIRVGWSIPRARRDYTASWITAGPALVALAAGRRLLPARAARSLVAGRFDAIMAHWRLVTPALAAAVAASGGQLYVWTVDDPAQIERLAAMGVDGIITNDPRLFPARSVAAGNA